MSVNPAPPGYQPYPPGPPVYAQQPVGYAPVGYAPVGYAPMMQPQQQQQQQQQMTNVTVISQPGYGGCPHTNKRGHATPMGIICCILFFPIGLIYCLFTMENVCENCGARF